MSRLVVETFARDAGFVAIAHYEGQLIAKGGVGGGESERAAIQEAVNCLYMREDERSRAEGFIDSPSVRWGAGWIPEALIAPLKEPADSTSQRGVSNGRITGLANIVRTLEAACKLDPKVKFWLEYNDSQGEYTEREIVALGLDERSGRDGFRTGGQMLVALDTAKDEPRHFRVDRIGAITERS